MAVVHLALARELEALLEEEPLRPEERRALLRDVVAQVARGADPLGLVLDHCEQHARRLNKENERVGARPFRAVDDAERARRMRVLRGMR